MFSTRRCGAASSGAMPGAAPPETMHSAAGRAAQARSMAPAWADRQPDKMAALVWSANTGGVAPGATWGSWAVPRASDPSIRPRPGRIIPPRNSPAALREFSERGFGAFSARWNLLHAYQGQQVVILDRGEVLHEGLAAGVDDSGRLLLDGAAGRIAVLAGDVSLRPRGA